MPNKCVSCGKIHDDDAEYILKGCDVCGSKFFIYIPYESMSEKNEEIEKLSKEELEEIEKDIRSIIDSKEKKDEIIIMDFESIKVLKPGVYNIDLINISAI